jgi:hypothetical protein
MTGLFNYINWIAVAVAALAYFILGAVWYSKALFAKKWIAYLKIDINDPNAKKGVGMMFGGSFLMMFVVSLAIAILAERLALHGCWLSGVKLGAFVSVCFSVTGMAINYLYEKKPFGLLLINGGYQVLGSMIAGVIICCWPNG